MSSFNNLFLNLIIVSCLVSNFILVNSINQQEFLSEETVFIVHLKTEDVNSIIFDNEVLHSLEESIKHRLKAKIYVELCITISKNNLLLLDNQILTTLPYNFKLTFPSDEDFCFLSRYIHKMSSKSLYLGNFDRHVNKFAFSLITQSFLNEMNITNLNSLMHENHMFSIDKFSNLNIESNERNSIINHHKVINELDSQEDHEEVFQLNVACQLWWPANHSDIFIYAAPVSNVPLQYNDKIIISCPFIPSSDFLDLVMTVKVSSIQSSQSINFNTYEFESYLQKDSFTIGFPLAYDINGLILISDYDEHQNISRSKIGIEIKIYIRDTYIQISEFYIKRMLKIGTEELTECSGQNSLNHMQIPPMSGLIPNRNLFGYALSYLSPHAKVMVEVGVQRANFAELIQLTWGQMNRYILVDPWVAQSKNIYLDIANKNSTVQNDIYTSAYHKIKRLKESDRNIILKMTSMEASHLISDLSVDIVYLDAIHHYSAVVQDMNAWWPKIRSGGILAGHDYLLDYLGDTVFTVQPAVDEFARNNCRTVFTTKDNFPTWFIYK